MGKLDRVRTGMEDWMRKQGKDDKGERDEIEKSHCDDKNIFAVTQKEKSR